MKSKANILIPLLNNMSRQDLAGVAKAANAKVGKSKANTVANVVDAIANGKIHGKVGFSLSTNPTEPGSGQSTQRMTHYAAVFRTYLSGPGQENEIRVTPDVPVHGSPSIS